MPVLPIMPANGPIAPGHREPLGQLMQPHPSRGVAATGKNITVAAVQQGQAALKTDMSAQRPVVNAQDKRHRLVGPPPSFEVNVIQHLRESLADPQLQEEGAHDDTGPGEPVATQGIQDAYGILSAQTPPTGKDAEIHIDISV
ncbi:hypothetical protein [Roseinatronobacter sp.]